MMSRSRTERLSAIRKWIAAGEVSSQQQLVEMLEEDGFNVTQATVSRDLVELRAVRSRTASGDYVYVFSKDERLSESEAQSRLIRLIQDTVSSVRVVAHQIVLRTQPGAAQFLAAAIDGFGDQRVLGTIAGDDTVLVLCPSDFAAEELSEFMLSVGE